MVPFMIMVYTSSEKGTNPNMQRQKNFNLCMKGAPHTNSQNKERILCVIQCTFHWPIDHIHDSREHVRYFARVKFVVIAIK